MTRRVWWVSSPLSPEMVHAAIDEGAAWENRERPKGEKRDKKVKLTWTGEEEFEIRITFYGYFEGSGVEMRPTSISAGAQVGMSWDLSESFQGKILPDGNGGSRIEGAFYMTKRTLGFMIGWFLGWLIPYSYIYGKKAIAKGDWTEILPVIALLCFALLYCRKNFISFIRAFWECDRSSTNQGILWVLMSWLHTPAEPLYRANELR